jgi:putative hydrolase of the HAD superfamily
MKEAIIVNKIQPTVFWDFDGTLVTMPGLYRSVLIDVLNENEPEHHIDSEKFKPHLKAGFPWHEPEKSHIHLNINEAWWENLEKVFALAYQSVGFNVKRSQKLATQVRKYIVEPRRYVVYEDTISALKRVREKGWRQGILSNNIPELPDIVKALGLSEYLDFCITSASIGYEKPNPEAFRIALSLTGNPEKVWMIGDNYLADVKGAEAVGISAILVRTVKNHDTQYYASDLNEAINIIMKYL